MFKHIGRINTAWLSSIGFDSVSDFLNSVIGIKHTTIPLIATSLTGLLSIISSFVGEYIYTPAWGIFILFILTGADVLTGISNSLNQKITLKPERIGRGFVRFVTQVFIVFIFTQLSIVWEFIVMKWMVDVVLFTFVISVFWSVVKHTYDLGWIKEENYKILENALDINKLLGLLEMISAYFKGNKGK